MQELISRLTEKAGISPEQASKAVDTIKEFVKEKFPMMSGAVDNLLSGNAAEATASNVAEQGSNFMDKISDVIPGETGQKVEDFAKNAAEKAEDLFDAAKDKLSGLFGGGKK
jgi:CHASE3 domain sensor protein